MDDDLPPLVGENGEELPEDPDSLPPLVNEDGTEVPLEAPVKLETASAPAEAAAEAAAAQPAAEAESKPEREPGIDYEKLSELPEGMSEEDALKATAALHAATRVVDTTMEKSDVSETDAVRTALAVSNLPKDYKEPSEVTKRMVHAIAKDDHEEVEDAIFQGADVTADCGAGMQAIHLTALRGESYLTELLIAHGASVNTRDMSGNTPLIYTCHFFKQHKRGTKMVAQLLHHRADPFYRVKDGKFAGVSAMDMMDKEIKLPQLDENAPRQMRAMIQLAMDGREDGMDQIAKMWAAFKSADTKLYQVSSKKDNFDYTMKNIDWATPENAKNAQAITPVKIDGNAESIVEEKYIYLKDYSFSDEGEKVKVYVLFPEDAAKALAVKDAVSVDFQFQGFDLKLRSDTVSYRLRIDPLFGSIEASECKHRISAGSKKVTLTLIKRHKNRRWTGILK